MKIRSAEYLVAIAIVTSAAVLQIREHMLPHEAAATGTQTAVSCDIKHDGLVPAGCEPTRGERPVGRAPQESPQESHNVPRMWV